MPKFVHRNSLFCLPDSKGIDMPLYTPGQTFKQAEKVKKSQGMQGELGI